MVGLLYKYTFFLSIKFPYLFIYLLFIYYRFFSIFRVAAAAAPVLYCYIKYEGYIYIQLFPLTL
jgi:hypothetical protein